MTSRRRIFRSLAADDGQAAVEFAIVAPALIALLLGIVQCGIAFSHYVTVTDAARAAARKAVLIRDEGLTASDITAAAQAAAPDLNASQLGVSVSDPTDPSFQQGGSTVQVTVTYPYSINVLGWVVSSGNLSSTMSERLE
ncbi:MAG TPA: TadE family protein [Gaiellaceae bacterium]|nr:TadE family protein [Gaiellaceae bacterium]